MLLLLFFVVNFFIFVENQCPIGDHTFSDGEIWLQNRYFNVTCRRKKISVLNCITEKGTFLPVGTAPFVEDGVKYTCDPIQEIPEGLEDSDASGETENGEIPGECENGASEYVYAGFSVSCLTNEILGCVNSKGELVVNDYYYLPNKALKFCKVFANGKKARIENRGCYNGTIHDDGSDPVFHVAKYAIWTIESGMQFRCGDNGIRVYKCPLPDGKTIHTGSAWLDDENVLNVCH